MDDQLGFASLDFAAKKKRTKRDVLLAEMAAVVLWDSLEARIAPHYAKPVRKVDAALIRSRRCCASTASSIRGRVAGMPDKRGADASRAHLRNLSRLQARSKPQRHTGSVAIRAAKNCVTSITPCITVSTRASSCQKGPHDVLVDLRC
jgi:hypothetical protein